jgi:hypothetical protein
MSISTVDLKARRAMKKWVYLVGAYESLYSMDYIPRVELPKSDWCTDTQVADVACEAVFSSLSFMRARDRTYFRALFRLAVLDHIATKGCGSVLSWNLPDDSYSIATTLLREYVVKRSFFVEETHEDRS